MFVNEESVFSLFYNDIAVVQFTNHTPGDFLGHGQFLLHHFRLRNGFRFGDRLGFRLRCRGSHRNGGFLHTGDHDKFPQRHIGRPLDFLQCGGGSFLFGLGRIF